MTTYILNSHSIQEIHKADLIHLQSICADNKSSQYSKEGKFELCLGIEWDLFGEEEMVKRSQLTERLTAAQLRKLETSRLACFHGICSKPLLHLDPGNCIHLG